MPASNSDKNKRGNSLKRVMAYMMRLCEELGYISSFEEGYTIGMPGYTDQNQFKASYRIEFTDDTEWIVYTTTSLRERIKEQYWDSYHIKNLNQQITEAYLVYPDGLEVSDRRSSCIYNIDGCVINFIKFFCDNSCEDCPEDKTSLWLTSTGHIKKCSYRSSSLPVNNWQYNRIAQVLENFV